jgi:uncharacterized protein YraI
MKHLARLVLAAVGACALPCTAQAQGQLAYTAKSVNVRAGPDRDYPVVALLPAGYQVIVEGCLADYRWCDVVAGPSRGWVYGGNLNYLYQNTQVPVLDYGAVIGIGVLGFAFNDYWGRHYHNRPWYRDRHRWADHRPVAPAPNFRPEHRREGDFRRRDGDHRRQEFIPGQAQPGFGPRPQPPAAIGPRALPPPQEPQQHSVVPRSQPSNPSGGVLPGPSPMPQQPTRAERRNASGGVLPGPSALPPQGTAADRANPSGGVLPVPNPPPRHAAPPRERPGPKEKPAEAAEAGRRSHQGEGGRGPDHQRR